jgi:hypothetical protein
MRALMAAVVTVALGVPTGLGAERDGENAAVKYLRADVALRQSYPLPPDAGSKLEKALESPLDGEGEKLVAAADEALVEFHHGAALKTCDWELSIEDGPLADTSHRGATKELVAVSGLRARLRFRDGNLPGAMNDALAAMAAARHLSVDGTLASVLFAYKLERMISGVLERNLDQFSPSQLNELAIGLDALPSGSTLGDAFEAEKVLRKDLLPMAQGAKTRSELIERLRNGIPFLQSNEVLAAEIVDGCSGSVNGFVNCVNQQQSFYISWAPRFRLSPEQFETEYQVEIAELSKKNPLIRMLTPALQRFRWEEAYCQTRRALLHAAIAVRLHGTGALSRHLDPYDGIPFLYISVDGGFRLESLLKDNGVSLSLTIVPGTEDRSASEQ